MSTIMADSTKAAAAPTRPTWTTTQTQTVHAIKAALADFKSPIVAAQTIAERSKLPEDCPLERDFSLSHAVALPPLDMPAEIVQGTNIQPSPTVYWTFGAASRKTTPSSVIFYIHGGGNTTNSPVSATYVPRYRQLLAAADREKTIIIAPAFRLATTPENAFPASHQDIFTVYTAVVRELGYNAHDVTVVGDSAGGNNGEYYSC